MADEANAAPTGDQGNQPTGDQTPPANPPPATAPPAKETPKETAKETSKETPPASPPEKFDLKAPENLLLDAKAYMEKTATIAREQGLSQQQAQAMLEHGNTAVSGFVEEQKNLLRKQVEGWEAEVKADKEFGGENLKESMTHAQRFASKYGTPELVKALEQTGFGSFPELFKAFVRAGKAMSNDNFIRSTMPPAEPKKTAAEILYGGSAKK
jgi:hypothetical protein